MTACRFCRLALPEGFGLGVCPHGDAHTACCLELVELRRAVREGASSAQVVEDTSDRTFDAVRGWLALPLPPLDDE